jgi:hypothetical protein
MTGALPKSVADYLDSPAGRALLGTDCIWFRWDTRKRTIESSGNVLKSTPEQMSRPGTSVFFRIGQGGWKRYC